MQTHLTEIPIFLGMLVRIVHFIGFSRIWKNDYGSFQPLETEEQFTASWNGFATWRKFAKPTVGEYRQLLTVFGSAHIDCRHFLKTSCNNAVMRTHFSLFNNLVGTCTRHFVFILPRTVPLHRVFFLFPYVLMVEMVIGIVHDGYFFCFCPEPRYIFCMGLYFLSMHGTDFIDEVWHN